ncbi:MAG: EAL domain-containing protein [Candidatus Izimaplasma sp.]|nr:EAL domain-containing protein [Candidatus Izimaplasma bacterium]
MKIKAFFSKRFNLFVLVTLIFVVLASILTFLIPTYLFESRMNEVENRLYYLVDNYESIDKVTGSEHLYVYKDGTSRMVTDVGILEDIDSEIEGHLIHWSEEQTIDEQFYEDDFQNKKFVYYIRVVDDQHYVVAYLNTVETHNFINSFKLYSLVFVGIMYLITIGFTLTYFSKRLIQQYSLLDPITSINTKTAFVNRFLKKDISNYHVSYHNIYNTQDIIGACGIKFSDMIIKSIGEKLKNTFKNEQLYTLSDNEFLVLSENKLDVHDLFHKSINTNTESDIIPYEFKVKSILVHPQLLKQMDEKTLVSRLKYTYSLIRNTPIEKTVLDTKVLEQINEEIHYQSRLQEAIDEEALVNFYQIKVNPKTNKVIGAEALSRWLEEEQVVSPAKYIPLAEANGLIIEIDLIGLKNACEAIVKLEQTMTLPDEFRISVNFSPLTLKNITIKRIKKILSETNCIPSSISIEVTESITLEFDTVENILNEITNLGITLEIDDFSAGNSSFTILPLIKASVVKLDMAILPLDEKSEKENLIYESLIDISNKLNYDIISEGVETQNQVDYLTKLKISAIQGYFYSKPVPFDKLIQVLKKYN